MNDSDKWTIIFDLSHNLLREDSKLLKYLYSRGVNEYSINRFQLGKFPGIDALISLVGADWLRHYGIIKGASYSHFINYPLIFPIKDLHGDGVGFAG